MLNPDMTQEIEETLYNDARNIYTTYLDPESADFLNLPMYISQGMKQSKSRINSISEIFQLKTAINLFFFS